LSFVLAMMIFRQLRTPLLTAYWLRVAAFSSVSKDDGARSLFASSSVLRWSDASTCLERVESIDASALCAQADSLQYQDRAAALPLYKRAAEQGDVDAMFKFAFLSYDKKFDFETAIEWCRRAANLGDAQARSLLGRLVMNKVVDGHACVGHMVAAAQRGHVFGAFWPHEDLTRNIGGDWSDETKWLFDTLAIAGELDMAWWFVEGRGFPRNVVRARELLVPLLKNGARASQCLSKLKEVRSAVDRHGRVAPLC
jgi:TPR repeat protein